MFANGCIPLKIVLFGENNTNFCGTLSMISTTDGQHFADLDYEITIKTDLLEAIVFQKVNDSS